MNGISASSEILGAMITPAVLISASGVLVLSTSHRVGRTVDRVRVLAAEVERLQTSAQSVSPLIHIKEFKRKHIGDQLMQLSERALLLRSALTALYSAIGLLVTTSILVGVVALLEWSHTWLPVVSGFAGSCALLYGSLLLVREARLAVRSTLQEVSLARQAVIDSSEQGDEADKTRRKNDPLFLCDTRGYSGRRGYLRKEGEIKMKIKIASFVAVLLIGGFGGTSTAIGFEDVLSKQGQAEIQQPGEISQGTNALRSLVLALSSGKDAIRPLRGSPSENDFKRDRLSPPIEGMECHIDRIASYISCYSYLTDPEKADTLYARLIDEIQAALPSDTWKGIQKEPGMSSVRSYTYEDQNSNAHIDIDILAQLTAGGQNSYMVSIFAWPH